MLRAGQAAVLVLVGVALWGLVAWAIRALPPPALAVLLGPVGFAAAPVGGALSLWLCIVAGRLSPAQVAPGVLVVGASAMMLDGALLHGWPGLYGSDERTLRLAAAWLLWGYGVAFAMAAAWTAWKAKTAPA